MFNYVYPGYRSNVPAWVFEQLLERARTELTTDDEDIDFTRGPLISRFSFTHRRPRMGLRRSARRSGP